MDDRLQKLFVASDRQGVDQAKLGESVERCQGTIDAVAAKLNQFAEVIGQADKLLNEFASALIKLDGRVKNLERQVLRVPRRGGVTTNG